MHILLAPLAASPSGHVPLIYLVGAACCLLAVAGVATVVWLIVRASRQKAQPSQPIVAAPQPQPWPAPAPAPVDVADQLRRLADLRDSGVLTEEEFQAQKRRVLGT
jgi:hypothetical protein